MEMNLQRNKESESRWTKKDEKATRNTKNGTHQRTIDYFEEPFGAGRARGASQSISGSKTGAGGAGST